MTINDILDKFELEYRNYFQKKGYILKTDEIRELRSGITNAVRETYNLGLEDASKEAKIIYTNQDTDYGGPVVDKQSILKLKK